MYPVPGTWNPEDRIDVWVPGTGYRVLPETRQQRCHDKAPSIRSVISSMSPAPDTATVRPRFS
jgi:hypothetical protein